jgi:hypothetical protein
MRRFIDCTNNFSRVHREQFAEMSDPPDLTCEMSKRLKNYVTSARRKLAKEIETADIASLIGNLQYFTVFCVKIIMQHIFKERNTMLEMS